MKLLLDQNLSHRLVDVLQPLCASVSHVGNEGLAQATDDDVWRFARQRGLTIVSKDSDFSHRAFLYGAPPKVVWLHVGNCSTQDIETLLITHLDSIRDFHEDESAALLIIP